MVNAMMRAVGLFAHDLANGFDAIHIRHDDIHRGRVRPRRTRECHRLSAVLGLGRHREAAQPLTGWRKPWRIRVWSSAIKILIGGMIGQLFYVINRGGKVSSSSVPWPIACCGYPVCRPAP